MFSRVRVFIGILAAEEARLGLNLIRKRKYPALVRVSNESYDQYLMRNQPSELLEYN